MYSRFDNAVPQMMQRHTGTAWVSPDATLKRKLPVPLKPASAPSLIPSLKTANVTVRREQKTDQ